MNRKALGRGLEALIPERPPEQVKTEKEPEKGLVQLDVDKIRSNPYQPRTAVDEAKLAELSASIKEKGIIQPVVVRQVGDEFELVAGERRLLAAKKLGLKIVSAIMAGKLSKAEMMELSLIENLQREDLNPIDVANGYKRLLEECNLSQQELAAKVGKDRSSVANTLRLLSLPEGVRKLISSAALSEGHARAILSLSTDKERIELSRRVVQEGLSVRKTEELAYGRKKASFLRTESPS